MPQLSSNGDARPSDGTTSTSGDPTQTEQLVAVRPDVLGDAEHALGNLFQRVYHVTFGRMHSFDDFVAATRSLYPGFAVEKRVTAKAGFAGFPKVRPATSDLAAATAELGYAPLYDLAAALAESARWLMKARS